MFNNHSFRVERFSDNYLLLISTREIVLRIRTEKTQPGACNEYSQHMFSRKNYKNILKHFG